MCLTSLSDSYPPPSSAEIKEWVALYIHSPNTPSWRGVKLKHRDNFTFTFVFICNREAVDFLEGSRPTEFLNSVYK
jgi:hypothetical protein